MSAEEPNPDLDGEQLETEQPGEGELQREYLTKLHIEHEARWALVQQRQTRQSVALIALGATLGFLALYGFSILARHNLLLTRNANLRPAVENLSAKVGDLAGKTRDNDSLLTALLMDQQDLRDQMLGPGGKRRKAGARENAAVVDEALRARVAKLETLLTSDQSRIAGLQQELAQVRGQHQIAPSGDDQQRDRSDVSRTAGNPAVERIGFEVSKGHSTQLTSGISLGLTKTDAARHRADGWMWLMPDRRTIWLREQSAQDPLTFYSASDGRKRELVITQVTRDSIAGYLLLSKRTDAAGADAERRTPMSDHAASSPSGDTRNQAIRVY